VRVTRGRWTLHAAAWIAAVAAFRIVLTPAEVCPEASLADLDAAITGAATWAVINQDDRGRFTYGYDRDADEVNTGYNLVRHAGMVSALYQLAADGDERWLEGAEAGLGYLLDLVVETGDDAVAIAWPGVDAKIGAAGLTIAALHHRQQALGDGRYDELMRELGRFLVGQIEPRGSILGSWSPETGAPVPGYYAKFGTGEAFWALTLLASDFPGEGWDSAARSVGRYIATERREAEDQWLRQPDHWAAYGFAELGASSPEELTYLRQLAGDFGVMTRFESTRQGTGPGAWLRGPDALGAGVGALGEGLGSLWRLSAREPGLADIRDDLDERLSCVAGLLVERQVDADDAADSPRPELVEGAWFRQGATLLDDQQHTLSALLIAREAAEGRAGW
jgi:hypothetical protein